LNTHGVEVLDSFALLDSVEGRQDHDLLMQVVYEMASRSPNGELTLKFPDDDEGPVEPLTFKIRKGSPGRQN
jgi:hypothetical protein